MNNKIEKEYRDGRCDLHPEELMIGVCALCLHQRLLILAKKQQQQQQQQQHYHNSYSSSIISLHKVFAFGSFLHRLHIVRPRRRRKSHDHDGTTAASSISQQESFISINLEDNSIATSSSWEKKAVDVPKNNAIKECKKKDDDERGLKTDLVEHTMPRYSSDMRWQNRIGHWFQLIGWKKKSRSNSKGNGCQHVGSKISLKR